MLPDFARAGDSNELQAKAVKWGSRSRQGSWPWTGLLSYTKQGNSWYARVA